VKKGACKKSNNHSENHSRFLFLSNIKEDQTYCLTSSHCCKPTYFKVFTIYAYIEFINGIGDVMICMLTSSMVDRDLESRSCQTNDYKIGICCFSAKHSSCRSKNKYWFARKILLKVALSTIKQRNKHFNELMVTSALY
jgi:hypothetical protein